MTEKKNMEMTGRQGRPNQTAPKQDVHHWLRHLECPKIWGSYCMTAQVDMTFKQGRFSCVTVDVGNYCLNSNSVMEGTSENCLFTSSVPLWPIGRNHLHLV